MEKEIEERLGALFLSDRNAAEAQILGWLKAGNLGQMWLNQFFTFLFGEKGDGPWCQQPIGEASFREVVEKMPYLDRFAAKWAGRLLGWSFRPGFCAWSSNQYENMLRRDLYKLLLWDDRISVAHDFVRKFPWRDVSDPWFADALNEVVSKVFYSDLPPDAVMKTVARSLLVETRMRVRTLACKLSQVVPDEYGQKALFDQLRIIQLLALFGTVVGNTNPLTKQEVEFRDALDAKIEATMQEQKARLERERQDRELKAAAEVARRDEENRRRKVFEHWEGRIADRCRHIVTVFNGIYGLDIDPDAVLQGVVPEKYAYITSGSSDSGYPSCSGQRLILEQCQDLRPAEHGNTWLTIEEGNTEEEMRATFDAANFLVWHELAHLSKPSALNKYLSPELLPPDSDEELRHMAREVVIDAIAFRLAKTLYVHPDRSRHLIREWNRQEMFCRSHNIQLRRVLRAAHNGSQGHSPLLIARLAAEAGRHLEFDSRLELKETLTQAEPHLAIERKALGIFREIYFRALTVDILTLDFRPSLCDEAENRDSNERFMGIVAA